MFNAEETDDILERLRHPEREAERHRPDRLFLVRNALNGLFILLAVVAMAGIAIAWGKGGSVRWCYIVGLIAVFVKMIEAMLRMPHFLKRPSRSTSRRTSMFERAREMSAYASPDNVESTPNEQQSTQENLGGTQDAPQSIHQKVDANLENEEALKPSR